MVLYTLETGSSPNGHHAIKSFLECPRRSNLDGQSKNEWLADLSRPLILDDSNFSIGTLFHAYQDLYISGKIASAADLDDVEFNCEDGRSVEIDFNAMQEAKRMSSAWMGDYGPDALGNAIETEFKLPDVEKVQKAWAREHAGGRIDFVTKISSMRAGYIAESFGVVLEPGLYGGDWKTEAAERSNLADEHLNSLQPIGYMVGWNSLMPKNKQLKGFLVLCAIKTKVPKFRLFARGLPRPNEVASLQTRHAVERAVRASPVLQNYANTNACFPFLGKPCRHFVSGACPRY